MVASYDEMTFLDEELDRTLDDVIATEPSDTYEIVYDLMKRVFGEDNQDLVNQFNLELIVAQERDENDLPDFIQRKTFNTSILGKALYLDVMELDNNGTNGIILRGSSTIALCVAFNWYLEEYCNTTYDWRTYSLDLPSELPLPPYQKNIRSVPYSYYENVCTVSYTQAFWSWTEWETHLDWMAMQGINLPLSFTGQEYIFSKTFYEFNFTQSDLQGKYLHNNIYRNIHILSHYHIIMIMQRFSADQVSLRGKEWVICEDGEDQSLKNALWINIIYS